MRTSHAGCEPCAGHRTGHWIAKCQLESRLNHCENVPPTSAWQPPSAALMVLPRLKSMPTAAAVSKKVITLFSGSSLMNYGHSERCRKQSCLRAVHLDNVLEYSWNHTRRAICRGGDNPATASVHFVDRNGVAREKVNSIHARPSLSLNFRHKKMRVMNAVHPPADTAAGYGQTGQ